MIEKKKNPIKKGYKLLFAFVLAFMLLNISGCFKWASRAFDNFPTETALDKTYKFDGKVLIIGAGASGLAAAKILEKNKVDYQILEATNRYGGRLKKDTSLADFPIDIGAEWIHNMPQVLNRLKGKKADDVDEELIRYHLEEYYKWDGESLSRVSDWYNNSFHSFMPEYKFKHSSWFDFVETNFANEVKHRIVYNDPVEHIDYSGKLVKVRTAKGKEYLADRVLLTVSIGVLKSNKIDFVPNLSDSKQKTIQAVPFLPGFKLVMRFNEKFYPDALSFKTENGEKGFYDMALGKDKQANILGMLVTGDAVNSYYELGSEEVILKEIIRELDLVFDGKASSSFSGDYVLENWGKHAFTMGTWVEGFRLSKNVVEVLNEPLDSKIYFAGEAYDQHRQMGVPGALLSGYVGIDKLLLDKD